MTSNEIDFDARRWTFASACLRAITAAALLCGLSTMAAAQSFSTVTSGEQIGPNATCGTADELNYPIVVTGLTSFDELKFGFQATTTYRGDLRVRLSSPAGTTTELITSNGGEGNANLNVEIDDGATDEIYTGDHTDPDGSIAPPYENLVSTNNPVAGGLGSFDGEDPSGTWTVNVCDGFNADQGNFGIATLFFANTSDADLSLNVDADTTTPETSDTVILTYTLVNSGPAAATNVTASAPIPAGLTLITDVGAGMYNTVSGVWTLPTSLASGSISTLTLTTTAASIGAANVVTEITASDQTDSDSTPNNGVSVEDDYSTVTINVQPSSIPPTLSCPAIDQFELVFGAPGTANGWTSGDTTRTFTAFDPVNSTNIDLDFELTGDTTGYLGAIGGTNTPVSQTDYNGGFTGDYSIGIAADFDSPSKFVTMGMDIGTPGVGIGAFQFIIFDVDLGGWVDRLQFRGSLNTTPVTPLITPSTQNFVSGNEAIGQGGNAAQTSSAGNVIVTFNQPVDRVEWDYGNDISVGPDPAFQIIAMHTIKMCGRRQADVNAVKTVEVYDPGALGLYMTPGNEVLYKIVVTNSATATAAAEDVDISDTLPTNLKFISATTTGFTGGAFGSPALPASNQDCAVTACVIRYSGGDVPIDTTAEIQVRALIK
jgi:uncharacterized repeat protein (TIGR01451 family)